MNRKEMLEEAKAVLTKIVLVTEGQLEQEIAKEAAEKYMGSGSKHKNPEETRFMLSETVVRAVSLLQIDVLYKGGDEMVSTFFSLITSYGLLDGLAEAGVKNVVFPGLNAEVSISASTEEIGELVVKSERRWEPDRRTKAANEAVRAAVAEAQAYAARSVGDEGEAGK